MRTFFRDLPYFCSYALLLMVALAVGVFAAPSAQAEKRVALVIGNGDYGNQPLSNPANDAALMADTLRDVGFEVVEVINADSRSMKKAVHTFSRTLSRAGSEAVGFVYYAGHGIQAQGENYMIPVDAQIEEAIDVELEGFPASTLLSVLQNAGNRLNIVVMDACRNNPYKAATRSGGSGLARMDAPSGTLIAYSTAPGKVAADGRGNNSPYTRALSRAIKSPGAKVEDVFKTVRVAVMDRTNDAQVPWESSSLTGDFYFLEEEEPEPAPVAVPAAPAQPDNTVELAYWDSIKDSTDAALFDAYLSQYPNGLFAPLARAKITVIQKNQAASHNQNDTAFFQAIQNSNNKADFEAYLEQYPNGTFASLAQARIAAIDQRALQAAQTRSAAPEQPDAADRALWNEVKDTGSLAEFQFYLQRFPNGQFADIARARIAGIEEQKQVAALTPALPAHPLDGEYRLVIKGGKSASNQVSYPFCAPLAQSKDNLDVVFAVKNGVVKTEVISTKGAKAKLEALVTQDGKFEGVVTSRGKLVFTVNQSITAGPIEKARSFSDCRMLLTIEKIGDNAPSAGG